MPIRSKMMMIGLACATLGLSACGSSLFTSPKENPVINDALTPAEYRESMTQLAIRAFELVELELEENGGKIGHAPVSTLTAPQLQRLDSLAQYLDAELAAKAEATEGVREPAMTKRLP